MNDFTSLVRRLNEISDREENVGQLNESVEQSAPETVDGAKSTANILRKFSEIESEIVAEEAQAKEDVSNDISTRFRDFMKSEVTQGNDLEAVNSAVKEAHNTASILSGSIGVLADSLKRQLEATKEGGVLQRMVEREGGDTSHITKAYEALELAAKALDAAHMYAVNMDETVNESRVDELNITYDYPGAGKPTRPAKKVDLKIDRTYPGDEQGSTSVKKNFSNPKASSTYKPKELDVFKGDLDVSYDYPGAGKPTRPAKKIPMKSIKPKIQYNYDMPGDNN
jgi:hypothetical protein